MSLVYLRKKYVVFTQNTRKTFRIYKAINNKNCNTSKFLLVLEQSIKVSPLENK